MTPTTPLEQAVSAWNTTQRSLDETQKRQIQLDRAFELAEWGVFSNWNIAHITGLGVDTVAQITNKTDKTGGRFNPQSLPFILDLWLFFRRNDSIDLSNLLTAVDSGTSCAMISKLTGIGRSRLYAAYRKASS